MAGKGAKATAAKSADKDKGKKAGGPVSRSSRAAPQASLLPPPLGSTRCRLIRGCFRFGVDADMEKPMENSTPKKDVYQLFAEKVRDNKQLESRWAIMQETRVEYFRGKDFNAFIKNYPEVREILGPDKDLEVEDIVNTLLTKNLVIRCDRVMKTVRPGKKKLSSWPAHLEIHNEQVFTENDGFYAWMFLKRRTLWQTVLSFVWPLFALAVCLFPVYPYQCKIVVLYSLRAAIFGILWVLLGKRVWFFPNINAEETTFRELVRFWPEKDEGERPKWTSRLFYALVALLVILLLRHHAPDEAARARYQKKVSNIIDDVLEWSPKLAISGMIEKHTGANITEESNYTSRAASSHVPPSTKAKASEAGSDTDIEANLDEAQDSEYADDTRSNEA
ncbi:translocation protein-related [Zea mays]|uniref:Translocation protein SEC62 n=2 Tax=Zea mays TaxID=4577 RepID=A0A1D6GDH7_MAIZE|nr:translocation protein-related [Zea mays]